MIRRMIRRLIGRTLNHLGYIKDPLPQYDDRTFLYYEVEPGRMIGLVRGCSSADSFGIVVRSARCTCDDDGNWKLQFEGRFND